MTRYRDSGKRLLDLAISGLGALLSAPLVAAAAVAVWLEDAGNPLFRQTRSGQHGEPFTIVKLRTMPEHTDEIESGRAELLALTRVGRLLRRTNVDELPQLWNVAKGDMSLVGPRPALPAQQTLLQLRRETGAAAAKPGLTGLAQVNSYNGMPDEEKAKWDAEYVKNITLWGDVRIIARTCLYIFKPPPRY